MLTCRELVELVTDYLAGDLPPEEGARLEAHLEGCEPCRRFVEQMRETVRLAGLVRRDFYSTSSRSASQALWRARSSA